MKMFIIFVVLIIHFAFSTKFLNASGFNESYSLRSGLSAVNEAGIIFNNMEIWKDIKGYEGHYQISNFGRVKSLKRGKSRILKNYKHGGEYLGVDLYKNSRSNNILVHRLVVGCFVKNPLNKPCTNHKDGNKQNNHYKNLEWVTHQENTIHAYKNGLIPTKINHKIAKEIRKLYATGNYSQRKMASKYNLSQGCIGSIINYKTWKNEEEMLAIDVQDKNKYIE